MIAVRRSEYVMAVIVAVWFAVAVAVIVAQMWPSSCLDEGRTNTPSAECIQQEGFNGVPQS